jgi:hypothetical protein
MIFHDIPAKVEHNFCSHLVVPFLPCIVLWLFPIRKRLNFPYLLLVLHQLFKPFILWFCQNLFFFSLRYDSGVRIYNGTDLVFLETSLHVGSAEFSAKLCLRHPVLVL